MIEREEYMNQLIAWKDKQLIKVITGIRRCGKSTLMEMYRQYLYAQGVSEDQIIAINFEEMEYEDLLDYQVLYAEIKSRIQPNRRMYIFLDEIQRVNQYEKVVDSLYVKDHIDIYITGSNSYLFSSNLATNLRGRYVEIAMLPLSFREFYSYVQGEEQQAFASYLKVGGFPYIHQLNEHLNQTDIYLEGIYHTVLLKDIEERLYRRASGQNERHIVDVALLNSISRYLAGTIGSLVSLRNITNYLVSNERKVSVHTVSDYVSALCDAYLFYGVEPMDIAGKAILKSNKKYYIVDLGIRNHILAKHTYDLGFSLENIVFFELKRRGYNVYIGKSGGQEIDFIAKKRDEYTYIQVSANMSESATFEREITPLQTIKDHYPKLILTLDPYTVGNYNGIRVVNVIDWLLKKS